MKPSGYITGYIEHKGRYWQVSIEFGIGQKAGEVIGWMESVGVIPAPPPSASPALISTNPATHTNNGKGCPIHGMKSLKADNRGQGHYCSAKEGQGFCSRKSWKEWRA